LRLKSVLHEEQKTQFSAAKEKRQVSESAEIAKPRTFASAARELVPGDKGSNLNPAKNRHDQKLG